MNPTFAFLAMAALFISSTLQTEEELTEHPENSHTFVGNLVRLRCKTRQTGYPPSWSHTPVGSNEPADIYITVSGSRENGVNARMMEKYYDRFRVQEDRATGDYSLEIRSARLEDAGLYTCTARGGLGQQATAELVVFDSSARCSSNASEVLGENSCGHEPEYVRLTCSFGLRGNALPSVSWVKSNQLDVVRIEKAKRTSEPGIAVSSILVRADAEENLHGSHFTCIINSFGHSSESANDPRLQCSTPVINVIKLSNMTESKIVVKAEEVECKSLPIVKEKTCKWVKRKLGEETEDIVVSKSRFLNLYKPELKSGTYVCIVECDVRGQPCAVETIVVTYQPLAESTLSDRSSMFLILGIVLIAALIGIITFIIVFLTCRKKRESKLRTDQNKNEAPSGGSEMSSLTGDHSIDITDSVRLLGDGGDRKRQAEERAMARMRANAANKQNLERVSSNEDTDVAEGLSIGTGRGGTSSDHQKKDE